MSDLELARREERAQGGIIQFAEEMQAIRDGKLYPNAGQTDAWKTYCKERWGQSESNVRGTIQALSVLKRRSASGASAVPVNAAREVAALHESVQDAILDETANRDDVRAKSKAVRKFVKATEQNEGREATIDEQVEVAVSVAAVKPKVKRHDPKDAEDRALHYLWEARKNIREFNRRAADVAFSETGRDVISSVKKEIELDLDKSLGLSFSTDDAIDKILAAS